MKRSGKILPNRKHLKQVLKDGRYFPGSRQEALSVWNILSAAEMTWRGFFCPP